MKKKIIAMLLSACVLAGGCGGSTQEKETESGNVSEEREKETDSIEIKEKEEPEKTKDFKGIVVVDNENCSIKITGIEPDNFWGYTLNVNLENRSKKKNYTFSVMSSAINGVQTDPLFATDVSAGKKSNIEISFSDSSLKEYGVDEFTDIEITFRVYDSDDWEDDDVALETVHVYPIGEEKAKKFERKKEDTDVSIADNEEVSATIIGYRKDEIWGYTADIFLQNKTEKPVTFSVEDVSVNGYMSDPFWATSVYGGKFAFSSISWGNESLEENGITDVEEIEFVFHAYDEESMNDYFKEKVTLNP